MLAAQFCCAQQRALLLSNSFPITLAIADKDADEDDVEEDVDEADEVDVDVEVEDAIDAHEAEDEGVVCVWHGSVSMGAIASMAGSWPSEVDFVVVVVVVVALGTPATDADASFEPTMDDWVGRAQLGGSRVTLGSVLRAEQTGACESTTLVVVVTATAAAAAA